MTGVAPERPHGQSKSMTQIRPAATVVVLRDHQQQLEVLLVQRSSTGFASGAWVFPGGAVDAVELAGQSAAEAACAAAVRECAEETGLTLATEALQPIAHWLTPEGAPKRFATHFFAARAPRSQAVVVDGGEITDHRWASAPALLAEHRQGALSLMPPTYVTLLQLSQWCDTGSALAGFARQGVPSFLPRMIARGDAFYFLYQGDAGYEASEPELPGARHRSVMDAAGCRYERSAPGFGPSPVD